VVLSSFKTGSQIFSGSGFIPEPLTLKGYSDVFTDVHLERFLLNTVLYALGGTLGATIAGSSHSSHTAAPPANSMKPTITTTGMAGTRITSAVRRKRGAGSTGSPGRGRLPAATSR
jgi:ABC-type spermidine/putrescine transport system permease subunit II